MQYFKMVIVLALKRIKLAYVREALDFILRTEK